MQKKFNLGLHFSPLRLCWKSINKRLSLTAVQYRERFCNTCMIKVALSHDYEAKPVVRRARIGALIGEWLIIYSDSVQLISFYIIPQIQFT